MSNSEMTFDVSVSCILDIDTIHYIRINFTLKTKTGSPGQLYLTLLSVEPGELRHLEHPLTTNDTPAEKFRTECVDMALMELYTAVRVKVGKVRFFAAAAALASSCRFKATYGRVAGMREAGREGISAKKSLILTAHIYRTNSCSDIFGNLE